MRFASYVLAVGGVRGDAYQPPVWETFREFWPLYEAKDYEGALRVLEEGLEERPGAGIGLYNLACVESLLGRTDAAVTHLKQAIARDERFFEQARGDADFDSLRKDERFAALVSAG
jgi:tetratricopeptide (TPR) repeat protein